MADIYVVASGKGGVGKSTFVSNVALELARKGKKVLAVDCDIGLRSLDIMMDMSEETVYDWGDALLGRCSPGEVVTEGEAGLAAAPRNYDEAFTPEKFSALIKEISEGYDIVLIDSPAGIGSGFRLACSAAGKAIAVTTPDPVCVRSCARAVDEIKASGIEDVRLIINMFEAKSVTKSRLLNIDECVDITCARLLGVIPMDRTLVFTEVTGEEADEFAPASQAFFRITRRLLGERVPLFCE